MWFRWHTHAMIKLKRYSLKTSANGKMKTPNKNEIFKIELITLPSIWVVAPIGTTMLLISWGTIISSQAFILIGIVAIEWNLSS